VVVFSMSRSQPDQLRGAWRFRARATAGYGLLIGLTYLVFLLICDYGTSLPAPAGDGPHVESAIQGGNAFVRVLFALMSIMVTGQILARALAWVGQPPVIGDVVAGILLGPSLLGPEVSAWIMPLEVAPYLGVLAQLGIVLYMFLIGLELNPAVLKQRTQAMIAISHAGILLPFMLGLILALYLYPRLSETGVSFTTFALFIGVAMSITAFPILARILSDYGLTKTELGVVALSCAAVSDVTAWCLLAFLVALAKADVGGGLFVVGAAVTFVAAMFVVVPPIVARIAQARNAKEPARFALVLIFAALLASSLTAEAIGVHAIFGAFLLGALIPHDSRIARSLTGQPDHIVRLLLLPAFFAYTGMRTDISLLSEPSHWLMLGLIVLVATAGKLGGTVVAGRLAGFGWRNAAMLGSLMNTRGLMELIVLNIGLDLGVISPTLFAMMVMMALVTTALTSPLLRLLQRQQTTAEAAMSMRVERPRLPQ
jgi:Kef-type K+ transport system membrane component KefB